MAEINILRVIFGLLLVLFLPGWTMINMMFPRRGELDEEFDGLYRATLGMAMSIAVVILVGFVLGNPGLGKAPEWEGLSDGDKGYFQTFFITTALLLVTGIFFVAGWWRGAYPKLAYVHPKLARAAPGISVEADLLVEGQHIPQNLIRIHGLKEERRRAKEKITMAEKKSKATSGSMRSYYLRQRKIYLEDLADIDMELAELQGPPSSEVPDAGSGITEGVGASDELADDVDVPRDEDTSDTPDESLEEQRGDEPSEEPTPAAATESSEDLHEDPDDVLDDLDEDEEDDDQADEPEPKGQEN